MNSCWANFCAVKIAVIYVYCHCFKAKHEFVVAEKRNMVSLGLISVLQLCGANALGDCGLWDPDYTVG